MSCYFRHLAELFAEAGVEVTKQNRKALHAHIAAIVGDADDHCPTTWRLIKAWRADPQKHAELVRRVGEFQG